MASLTRLQDRYQLQEVLGRGGMGVVYKARDTLMNRHVALKTILDVENRSALDLFYKEWGVQASIVHPNIVEIYDVGEFDEEGVTKPFFVMPLLPGVTLDHWIENGSPALSVERTIGIICQACRGLQAAHDAGLVHRDLKPSNLFVMEDDSVKIIDFGVAHLVGTGAKTTVKGTLSYMAPEQVEMKAPSALTDIFSLAVVCYQALTRRLPFEGGSEYEVTEAILKSSPPPISELNSSVNDAISSVVHKALAKRPWHRFPSAREFAESLTKALHNKPLAFLDPEKIRPRVERATKAFGEGDYEFASEVLFELEAEGHLDSQITLLRRQLDQAVRKTTIRQLLESARRFFEAGEYGLALRKTHEALELDSEDADVLSLKSEIEKEHRNKQVDEWFLLANQHLENQAFGQARQAIDSVLKLKPNDTHALQLSAQVEQLEKEAEQRSEDKKKLYQEAVKAWQKGDVTSSMGKLESLVSMERDQPDTDAGRGATYQRFYQQVRSEHDELRNAYDEARNLLSDKQFAPAREICDRYLAKYPSHALFQALKVELDEGQRQSLSAYIAEIDQRVDAESDLDRRLAILEEALEKHPEEGHFERAARVVREKRDLVNSIVSKARFFEEKEQYHEALDQWQMLRTIHARHPGLDLEIERLTKRRDQQARNEAKARWGEQIDRRLEAGDYDRAVEIADNALAEFPDDDSLAELGKLARASKERSTEVMNVVGQGRDLCDLGNAPEGLALLRKARQLDVRNPVARKVLINYLTSEARRVVDSNWQGASELVKEVLDLEPDHSAAKSLQNQIADREHEASVSSCLAQARRLQAAGDIAGARAAVEAGLASFPNEASLKQLLRTFERAESTTTSKTRAARSLEELKRIERTVAAGVDSASAADLLEQVRSIAQRHPEQQAAQSLAAQLRNQLADIVSGRPASEAAPSATRLMGASSLPPAQPAAPPERAAEKPGRHSDRPDERHPTRVGETTSRPAPAHFPHVREDSDPQPKQEPRKAAGPGLAAILQQKVAAVAAALPPPGKKRQQLLVVGASAAAVVIAILLGVVLWMSSSSEGELPTAASVPVTLQASPPGAAIWIDGEECGVGNCRLDLPPGTYQGQARLTGYQAAVLSFEVSAVPEENRAIAFVLEPLAPLVRVTSDLESGEVLLDGEPVGELEDGQFELSNLSSGEHILEIANGGSKASITFEVRPGSAPMIVEPIEASDLKVAAVGSLGNDAHLYSDSTDLAANLDGEEAGELDADGLDFADLSEGTHEVTLGAGNDRLALSFTTGSVPTLAAFLKSDRNVGGLRITTGEDDVTVYLNGREYRRKTRNGRLLVYLYPREYKIRVEKAGFETVAEQVVEVQRGEQARLDFELTPLPETASLTVRNAPPGAEILLDNQRLGIIPPGADSGTFTFPSGNHTVTLRQELYESKEWKRTFDPGESVELDGALSSAAGTLEIRVEPAGVDPLITLRNDREAEERAIQGRTLTLAEGTYTITARAQGYQDYAATVRVNVGQTKTASLTLSKAEPAAVRPISLLPMLSPENGWQLEGKVLTRQGGGFVILPHDPQPGVYQLTVIQQSGRRLEWVVGFQNEQNHVLFQLGRDNLIRTEVVNGERSRPSRTRHDANRNEFLTIRVAVSADEIHHSLYQDQQWVELDSWRLPGANFSRGRFGFYVPGRDKIGVSSFTFTPR